MASISDDLALFTERAGEVAAMLKALASRPRLMVLCQLVEQGEMRAGDLVAAIGLSQSALSQHLAKMRDEGLVTFRRDGKELFYRIADPRCETLLTTLHALYCTQEQVS
jgi:ArsR family transcriptional regulator, virulence genes transcriptional regulator